MDLTLPIGLAILGGFVSLIGSIIGGASLFIILRNIIIFGLLTGSLGFALVFLLKKWGIDLNEVGEENTTPSSTEENMEQSEGQTITNEPVNLENQTPTDSQQQDSSFDYTVQDDEEIEFKPLDETLLKKNSKKKQIKVDGEDIEFEPQKAAMAIRKLLSEDTSNGE